MGKIVRRGKRHFIQNTHNGAITGKGYKTRKDAAKQLAVNRRRR